MNLTRKSGNGRGEDTILITKITSFIEVSAKSRTLALKRFIANQKHPFQIFTIERPINLDSQILKLQFDIKNTQNLYNKEKIKHILEQTVSKVCSDEFSQKNLYIIYTYPMGRLATEELFNHAKWMEECLKEAGIIVEMCDSQETQMVQDELNHLGELKTFTNVKEEEFISVIGEFSLSRNATLEILNDIYKYY